MPKMRPSRYDCTGVTAPTSTAKMHEKIAIVVCLRVVKLNSERHFALVAGVDGGAGVFGVVLAVLALSRGYDI